MTLTTDLDINTDSDVTADVEARGLFRAHGTGHPLGWYPVGLSAGLAVGEVRRIELCDGRLVLYRGEDGSARVMTPYCKHMGSDLGVGDVVGDELRCAFHHWHYGPNGQCTKIPSGDRIPGAAVLTTFEVEEKWGIIWVFWGEKAMYGIPEFKDWRDDAWVYRAFEVPLKERLGVDPWVFSTNVFDFQHFRVVHGIPGLNPEVHWNDWGAEWTDNFPHPAVGEILFTLKLLGTNSVMSYSTRGDDVLTHIAATSPMGSQGTRFFISVATRRSGSAELFLDQQQELHCDLVQEDLPIMNTLRLGDDHLVASDRQLARYLRYVRDFPKATMVQLEARR